LQAGKKTEVFVCSQSGRHENWYLCIFERLHVNQDHTGVQLFLVWVKKTPVNQFVHWALFDQDFPYILDIRGPRR